MITVGRYSDCNSGGCCYFLSAKVIVVVVAVVAVVAVVVVVVVVVKVLEAVVVQCIMEVVTVGSGSTVEASMDPPNHTAYRCLLCVTTFTSTGGGVDVFSRIILNHKYHTTRSSYEKMMRCACIL